MTFALQQYDDDLTAIPAIATKGGRNCGGAQGRYANEVY